MVASTFYRNTATKFGGSLHATVYTVDINHTNLTENEAKQGGTLHSNNTAVNLLCNLHGKQSLYRKQYIPISLKYCIYNLIATRVLSASVNSIVSTVWHK